MGRCTVLYVILRTEDSSPPSQNYTRPTQPPSSTVWTVSLYYAISHV